MRNAKKMMIVVMVLPAKKRMAFVIQRWAPVSRMSAVWAVEDFVNRVLSALIVGMALSVPTMKMMVLKSDIAQ